MVQHLERALRPRGRVLQGRGRLVVGPSRGRPLPIYFGGASADAVRVGAEHADVYAVWGEPLSGFRERIDQIQSAATEHGRSLRFSVSLRPIVADTEEEAWAKGREILAVTEERAEAYVGSMMGGAKKKDGSFRTNEGSQRLLAFAEESEVHDERLWTALAKATDAAGNSTALVGSYEQVAGSLIEYVGASATRLGEAPPAVRVPARAGSVGLR